MAFTWQVDNRWFVWLVCIYCGLSRFRNPDLAFNKSSLSFFWPPVSWSNMLMSLWVKKDSCMHGSKPTQSGLSIFPCSCSEPCSVTAVTVTWVHYCSSRISSVVTWAIHRWPILRHQALWAVLHCLPLPALYTAESQEDPTSSIIHKRKIWKAYK